jgi:hypothetical protein
MKNLINKLVFKIRNGFCIEETWDLDMHLANHILPRLIAFKEQNTNTYPNNFKSMKEWHKVIDEMIWSFDYIINFWNRDFKNYEEEEKKCQKGLDLFAKYFRGLWD